MIKPNFYIVSGCNGAGKTTASFTILPEMLDCNEFINADDKNLFNLYLPICDYWMIFNNSGYNTEFIAEGYSDRILDIKNNSNFVLIRKMAEQ